MAIVTGCHSQGVARFRCAQAGCRDCLEALMQEHDRLVYYIVRRQEIGGIEYDELIQEGRIGLWQSILHFDPGRGNTFSSYAWVAIRHQVWYCLAYANQSGGIVKPKPGWHRLTRSKKTGGGGKCAWRCWR